MPSSSRPMFLWIFLGLLVAGGIVVGILLWGGVGPQRLEVKDDRYFKAGHRVGDLEWKTLLVGGTHHGGQFKRPDAAARGDVRKDFSRLATTYYHRQGPLGLLLERFNWFGGPENTYYADARMPAHLVSLAAPAGLEGFPFGPLVAVWSEPPIGKVLLGSGVVASYARPFQFMDYYESDERLIEMSQPPPGKPVQFTFVDDALQRGAWVRILRGPERATLQGKGPQGFYQVLVVDTIRGNPNRLEKDLLTREALRWYLSLLRTDGVICFHTSNRYYTLEGLMADLAADANLAIQRGHDMGDLHGQQEGEGMLGHFSSEWIFMARRPEILANLPTPPHHQAKGGPVGPGGWGGPFWSTPTRARQPIWSDDGSKDLGPFVRSR